MTLSDNMIDYNCMKFKSFKQQPQNALTVPPLLICQLLLTPNFSYEYQLKI